MNSVSAFFTTLFIVLSFSACGSGASSVSSQTPELSSKETISLSFSGIVIDGLISGSTVCLYLYSNAIFNENDAITTSSSEGVFSFSNISAQEDSAISLIAKGGVDTATGKEFVGELKTILYTSDVSSSVYEYVTPLTDLVATRFLSSQIQNYATLETSRELVGNAYVIGKENVGASPRLYATIFSRTQEIQQTLALLEVAVENAKGVSLTEQEKLAIRHSVKFAIISQIDEDKVLDLVATLTKLEPLVDVTFTMETKILLESQLSAIKDAIAEFTSVDVLTVVNLDNYQIALENEADKVYLSMQDGNTGVVPIDINVSAVINPPVDDANTTEADLNTTQLSFNGYIVDGYISGGTLCMDLDYNGFCTSTEPSTLSNTDGYYAFEDVVVPEESMIPIIGVGGEDVSIEKPRSGELKSIVSSQNIGSVYVTPVTDILMSGFTAEEIKYVDFTSASEAFAQALGFASSDLNGDPMQSVPYFIVSQELEHFKRIVEIVARRSVGGRLIDLTLLRNSIKKSLYAQILETGYSSLNIDSVLLGLEINLNLSILSADREFAIAQSNEVVRVLEELGSSADMNVFALSKLQGMLETIVSDAYDAVEYTDVNITLEMITESIFSKTDAAYDENACIIKAEYTNMLSDSNATVDFSRDELFGMVVKSNYGETQMYYPNLNTEKSDVNVLVTRNENYNFSFDEAWSATGENIYIQTDKNENDKYECYRATLNSKIASEINIVKVYSYSPL